MNKIGETGSMKHYERVCAYVDLDAIRTNMENMKQNIAKETKMIAVVKTDGYGHGAVAIAEELEPLDFLYGFAVATAEEAWILRHCGIKKPILILGYTFPYSYEENILKQIRMAVFREDMALELADCARKLNQKAKIHIKVDTAMSRVGIKPDDSGIEFIKFLTKQRELEIEGIFTHFAKADEEDKTAVYAQLDRYQQFLNQVEKECGINIPLKHCSNSAGIVEIPKANMNIVRAGITMYGLWPSSEVKKDIVKLTPALSLKSRIVYIKTIEKGTQVSYGGTFTAQKEMQIATIPVGYGDGYPRSLSSKGYVLIRGRKADILGRICMDQFMVDVTGIPEAQMGDEVTLIGNDGKETISMEALGDLSGRFNYELACDLGKRIPRAFLKNGKVTVTKDYFDDYR